eukprot:SAG31_NODE_14591_length_797_cov_5.481375_1_plen_179_part_00
MLRFWSALDDIAGPYGRIDLLKSQLGASVEGMQLVSTLSSYISARLIAEDSLISSGELYFDMSELARIIANDMTTAHVSGNLASREELLSQEGNATSDVDPELQPESETAPLPEPELEPEHEPGEEVDLVPKLESGQGQRLEATRCACVSSSSNTAVQIASQAAAIRQCFYVPARSAQ